jgi:hypothetical protein
MGNKLLASTCQQIESNIREDLIGTRKELKVTEVRVYNDQGAQMSSYLIGLAAKDGVFVLSVSPAKKDVDPIGKRIGQLVETCASKPGC